MLKSNIIVVIQENLEELPEDITDKDYTHPQKVFEDLKLKNLGDYHNL